jgi:hypothetical protein
MVFADEFPAPGQDDVDLVFLVRLLRVDGARLQHIEPRAHRRHTQKLVKQPFPARLSRFDLVKSKRLQRHRFLLCPYLPIPNA